MSSPYRLYTCRIISFHTDALRTHIPMDLLSTSGLFVSGISHKVVHPSSEDPVLLPALCQTCLHACPGAGSGHSL